MATLKNTTINDTGFLRLPKGTTGQRPTAVSGMIRFNTTNSKPEYYYYLAENFAPLIIKISENY